MPRWFGSSGIRGSFSDVNANFSLKLGMAVGITLKLSKAAFIASDIRFTADILKQAFMSGYSYASGAMTDIGLSPTPVISHISAVRKTLGVMVTASHNPPSNNGFKFFLNGAECGESIEAQVETELQSIIDSPILDKKRSWDKVGTAKYEKTSNYMDDYIQYVQSKVKINNFDRNIILDCANNVPNLISPLTLESLGFSKVITINNTLDPTFPGRPSEPTSQNLSDLKNCIVEKGADIGIAHDGDGDRFAIIDEKGSFINSTTIINFFLDHFDYSNSNRNKIVLTSDCTSQAFEIAEKNEAQVITSRIGRNRDFVNDEEVLFLAEPNKLLLPELGRWIDGIYPVLKLLELSGSTKISKLFSPYAKRKILRRAFKISEEGRNKVKNSIDNLPTLWSNRISEISTLDGLKLFFKDQSSVLIRFSGTEPKIKFYVESDFDTKNEGILSQLKAEFELTTSGVDC